MNRIFVVGDTHGGAANDLDKLTSGKFPEGRELTKNDYVIIAGDFGLIWDVNESLKKERYWLDWLSDKPWTTLFISGNHENFDRLDALPVIEKFDGKVGQVSKSIFHLLRGEIYTIADKTFFCFGGAQSIDKIYRREFVSWWSQEIPNTAEIKNGFENLAKVNNKVDYVITHTIPGQAFFGANLGFEKSNDPLYPILDAFFDMIECKHWYAGHFHIDRVIRSNMTLLYNRVVEIK